MKDLDKVLGSGDEQDWKIFMACIFSVIGQNGDPTNIAEQGRLFAARVQEWKYKAKRFDEERPSRDAAVLTVFRSAIGVGTELDYKRFMAHLISVMDNQTYPNVGDMGEAWANKAREWKRKAYLYDALEVK